MKVDHWRKFIQGVNTQQKTALKWNKSSSSALTYSNPIMHLVETFKTIEGDMKLNRCSNLRTFNISPEKNTQFLFHLCVPVPGKIHLPSILLMSLVVVLVLLFLSNMRLHSWRKLFIIEAAIENHICPIQDWIQTMPRVGRGRVQRLCSLKTVWDVYGSTTHCSLLWSFGDDFCVIVQYVLAHYRGGFLTQS